MAGSSSPAGSDAASDCACDAGFTGPNGGTCTACPAGTYKAASGAGSCSSCPSGTNLRERKVAMMQTAVGIDQIRLDIKAGEGVVRGRWKAQDSML